jgi:Na+-driven multidrug efflux pump
MLFVHFEINHFLREFQALSYSEQDSPMRIPAERFLSLRALGAPAVVVSLALQGIFRGFKDTKTPVFCLGKCLVHI